MTAVWVDASNLHLVDLVRPAPVEFLVELVRLTLLWVAPRIPARRLSSAAHQAFGEIGDFTVKQRGGFALMKLRQFAQASGRCFDFGS